MMEDAVLPITLTGTVTRFSGNGRKLGYPTANIAAAVSLTDGIYFGYADLADYMHQPALVFVGTPITIGDTERRVEAHLLDIADVDYYDQQITLIVSHFHRANQKLKSVEALQAIMKADDLAARTWFRWQAFDASDVSVN